MLVLEIPNIVFNRESKNEPENQPGCDVQNSHIHSDDLESYKKRIMRDPNTQGICQR